MREQLFGQERLSAAHNFSNLLIGLRQQDIRERTIASLLSPGQTFEPAGRKVTETIAGQLKSLSDKVPEPGSTFTHSSRVRQGFNVAQALQIASNDLI